MVVAVRVHDRFVELVVTARLTVPANPFNGLTVIVEVAAVPTLVATAFGFAVTA